MRPQIDWKNEKTRGALKQGFWVILGFAYWAHSWHVLATQVSPDGTEELARKILWFALVPIAFPAIILQLMPNLRWLGLSTAAFLAFGVIDFIDEMSGTSMGIIISAVSGFSTRFGIFLGAPKQESAIAMSNGIGRINGPETPLLLIPYFLLMLTVELFLYFSMADFLKSEGIWQRDDTSHYVVAVFALIIVIALNALPVFMMTRRRALSVRKSLAGAFLISFGGAVTAAFFAAAAFAVFKDDQSVEIASWLVTYLAQLAAFSGVLILSIGVEKRHVFRRAVVLSFCLSVALLTSLPQLVPYERRCALKSYVPSSCYTYQPDDTPSACVVPPKDTKYLCWSPTLEKWHWVFTREYWDREAPPAINYFEK